jgi:uncharacterized protein (DUF1697 family)
VGGLTPRIALLRAVNVGGATVAMAELKAMATDLALGRPRTLLNSGNLVFDAEGPDADLEALLERETTARMGVTTDFMVRGLDDWRRIIAANPYPDEARNDPGHLLLLALKGAPGEVELEALRAAYPGRERLALIGRELYAVYPDGVGQSKLTVALMVRKLGHQLTGRNWNTVLKLEALAASDDR